MGLVFKVITDRKEFDDLRDAWNALASRSTVDHAFMRHEWLTSWLDNLAPRGQLTVVTGWRNGQLAAAAPLHIVEAKRRRVKLKMLSFLQSAVTPRCNFIVDCTDSLEELFAQVVAVRGWNLAEFKSMALDCDVTERFIAFLRDRGPVVVERGIASPYESLPKDWSDFEKSRSMGFRKRFRNSLNRCQKAGRFDILRLSTEADLDQHFDSLVQISRRSWKAQAGTDLGSTPAMAGFPRSGAPRRHGRSPRGPRAFPLAPACLG